MESTNKKALVIFAKAPIAGQVKTRLVGTLTAEEACGLYVCFLQDTFAMMQTVQDECEDLSLVLCYTPADQIEAFEAADLEGCLLLAQRGENLGERLQNCFADLFSLEFQSVIILGADTPTLPEEFALQSFEELTTNQSLILGPSEDGGYYLIGLKQLHSQLFNNISWGASTVLEQTQQRADEIGLTTSLLPRWSDVDTFEDLRRIQAQILSGEVQADKTARFLKKLKLSW